MTTLTEATYADGVLRVPFTIFGTFATIKFGTKARRGLGKKLANQFISSLMSKGRLQRENRLKHLSRPKPLPRSRT